MEIKCNYWWTRIYHTPKHQLTVQEHLNMGSTNTDIISEYISADIYLFSQFFADINIANFQISYTDITDTDILFCQK